MSMIPDDKVREVRERAAILDVISDYVNLRKSGANYQGICPFHGEKTPSFNVNPAREIFHCFGCGVGGNVFTFIMKIEGLAFPEAVKFVAKRVGVVIEDRPLTATEQRRQDEREQFYRVNELAARFYRRVLLEDGAGEAGRRYLERRGVDAATSEAYRLGFAPDRWDGLAHFLQQQRVPLPLAEKLGIVRQREGGGYYDIFRNRLIFTIADPQGRPIGFGGRVLDDSLPKYINSPESPIYHKSEVLFGVDLARQAMRGEGAAIIVEGYFDHLALFQSGVKNVVATCGTALTPGHLKLLQRYAGRFYTLFDSDSAGKKATFRAMELFLGENVPASVIELTAGEDPDSYLRKEGADAFAGRLKGARPIFDYFFRDLVQRSDTGSVAGKVAVIDQLTPFLAKISNPVERDLYVREIARVLGVEERALLRKLGKGPVTAADMVPVRGQQRGSLGSEEMLLALMGKFPEVAGRVREYGPAGLFSPEHLPIAETILAQQETGNMVDWGRILEQIGSPEERNRLAALFVADAHLDDIDPHKAFDQCLQARERDSLRGLKSLARELSQLDPDSTRYRELLEQMESLRNRKSQLL
ncbi:DNA primase [Geomobilimonas luticola]|uniref:DNA primase n=1 Tax=Geomobilimonas luticola TaxID=1114878 RepID=A0ABS5SD75_9BACT|nr:DNA primase [Geomobilimonas luticola]MBT0653333.1 DNA primase [Geomobilimonas luticola]